MTRPTLRADSRNGQFQKRVPSDVAAKAAGQSIMFEFPGEPGPVRVVATVGRTFVRFSLRTRDPVIEKVRVALAIAQFERFCEAVRNGPQPLTKKQTVALAGLLYRAFAENLEDNPGDPMIWAEVKAANEAALAGRDNLQSLLLYKTPEEGRKASEAARKTSLEKRFGGLVDLILRREGILTDEASRFALLAEAGKALTDAAEKLKRNADGDYTPDPKAARFPAHEPPKKAAPVEKVAAKDKLTFADLFTRWVKDTSPAPSTVTSWRSYWRQLKDFVGHDDPRRVTPEDVVRWKEALIDAGRKPKTVKDSQLAAVKAIFKSAVGSKRLTSNPADGITITVKKRAGQRMLPYTDDEVARLLALADGETIEWRRWIPWLTALSGARVGEIGQLWGKKIVQIDGVWAMQLTPAEDGGGLKNAGSERDVPLHLAIIERGFLDFVKAKGSGPLFYGEASPRMREALKVRDARRRGRRGRADDDTAGKRHTSKGVTNRLAAWIRENGFNDPRKKPNHALRHWMKTALQKAGVLDSVADAIQGHAGAGEAANYRHSGIAVMAEALGRVKVPKLP